MKFNVQHKRILLSNYLYEHSYFNHGKSENRKILKELFNVFTNHDSHIVIKLNLSASSLCLIQKEFYYQTISMNIHTLIMVKVP